MTIKVQYHKGKTNTETKNKTKEVGTLQVSSEAALRSVRLLESSKNHKRALTSSERSSPQTTTQAEFVLRQGTLQITTRAFIFKRPTKQEVHLHECKQYPNNTNREKATASQHKQTWQSFIMLIWECLFQHIRPETRLLNWLTWRACCQSATLASGIFKKRLLVLKRATCFRK